MSDEHPEHATKPIEFIVARLPWPMADGGMGWALVDRFQDEAVVRWVLGLPAADATEARVMDCLGVLMLEDALKVIHHPLFPYAPPRGVMTANGTWLDIMGRPFSRQLHSWLRLVRVHLESKRNDYVQALAALLQGKQEPEVFRPVPEGHRLREPHIPHVWWAPLPPFGRYKGRETRT